MIKINDELLSMISGGTWNINELSPAQLAQMRNLAIGYVVLCAQGDNGGNISLDREVPMIYSHQVEDLGFSEDDVYEIEGIRCLNVSRDSLSEIRENSFRGVGSVGNKFLSAYEIRSGIYF